MKLLFVSPLSPYPPRLGSAVITLNHIRYLSTRHTVDLIAFADRKKANDLGDLPRWCNNVELVDRPPRWQVLLYMIGRMTRDPVLDISRFRSSSMSEAVDRRLADGNYDAVLFQTLLSAQFRPEWYRGPTIWSLEDPSALKIQRMLPMYPWYSRLLHRSRSDRLQRYERKQASHFGRVTFVNKEDALEYKCIVPQASTDWVPHGIDPEAYRPCEEELRREGMIVITGNMFHIPNVDAVDFFCRDVFPLVCEQVASANLWLVGARPAKRVRKWANNPRVKVTGSVLDIRPYLHQAMISVCPVRLAIGTQTKILEALACGTPVVTTSAGNHGVGASSGEHLHVADDPVQFASKVVDLLKGIGWHDLSRNGRKFVEDNFAWSKSALRLEKILEQLASTSTRNLIPSVTYGKRTYGGDKGH
jgi:glycosyltransferase involved in cell wall biosynthesis